MPEKDFILWNGFCITHKKISTENILKSKNAINDIVVLAHPECEKEIRDLADYIGSTGEMINYGETLLKNELNVLLTRGVNGLYVYAVDEELQKALKNAIK